MYWDSDVEVREDQQPKRMLFSSNYSLASVAGPKVPRGLASKSVPLRYSSNCALVQYSVYLLARGLKLDRESTFLSSLVPTARRRQPM